jgi:transglutaminase-like putative cysteine protease
VKINREEIMSINRREMLQGGAMIALATGLPPLAFANTFAPTPGDWRTFQTLTRVEIKRDGPAQAWLPLPTFAQDAWFRPQSNDWTTNASSAEIKSDPKYGAQLLHVMWSDNERDRFIEVTSSFATRDRSIDLEKPHDVAALTDDERKLYLAPTELIPTDGIVKVTSGQITARAKSDLEKVQAIYEWVVDNTYRNAKTRGCGIGDIASLLKSGNLGGKCADINALYVGLARAAGLRVLAPTRKQ